MSRLLDSLARNALEQSGRFMDTAERVRICQGLAEQLVLAGEGNFANSLLMYALDVSGSGKNNDRANVYLQLGLLLYRRGCLSEALEAFNVGLAECPVADDYTKARLLNAIGMTTYALGEWAEAELMYKSVIVSETSGLAKHLALANYAVLLADRGNRTAALKIEHNLLQVFDQTQDEFRYWVILANELYQQALLGQHNEFEQTFQALEDVIDDPTFVIFKYGTLDSVFIHYLGTGDCQQALAILNKCTDTVDCDKRGFTTRDRAWLSVRRAMLLRATGQADEAVLGLQEQLRQDIQEPQVEAEALYQLALSARDIGNDRLGALSWRRASAIFRRLGFEPGEVQRRRLALSRVKRSSRAVIGGAAGFSEYLGVSESIVYTRGTLVRLAKVDVTILLAGESGTGKSMLARMIHEVSARRARAFVRFDCTCNEEALVDSLLFGHRRGAFTGAVESRRGLVDMAEGGTLFIDEVSDLLLNVQGKLLALLEDGIYRPVGGSEGHQANVRFIVATNRDLDAEVRAGRFRADLFYRLGSLRIDLPPLRERPEDIIVLCRAFLDELNRVHKKKKSISVETLWALKQLRWPGNARQVKKALERAFILGEGAELKPEDFGFPELVAEVAHQPVETLEEIDRQHIQKVLALVSGNKSKAARVLGVKRTTLYSRLDALGLK